MTMHLKTRITAVGPEVADLAEGGVLILFADGAPPELAEVSVLHKPDVDAGEAPAIGAPIAIGSLEATITALGPTAWKKVAEIGHVVVNFNDAVEAERPGEICASAVDGAALKAALTVGAVITIGRP
ncbi:PTS glucitol/sorbitol transporter subunit IIA [Kumtagia ephedrae]|uniref:PTS cellobiose transporter subunit IIB n=1 Tax=Kumtagia ephedrae TaxID=2116701 RepID=A0A2P7SAT8_9HYPH|nr:PTS glucitol/sorbitol transporter subunit IIA [Mesorhizobium ephedrae]PSJ59614.1 PTS cellobiose transporter subunit IIB [Mesorhizobium ephedrae]